MKPGASFSPLTKLVPTGMTPELEYLQVKWAAHLSYAAANSLLAEILPVADAMSVTASNAECALWELRSRQVRRSRAPLMRRGALMRHR